MLNPIEYKIKEYELLCSLVSVEEIVQWAYEEILRSDELDEMVMDLSLANDEDKQYKVFSQLDSKYESEAFDSVAFNIAELYDNKALDFHEVSSKLILMHLLIHKSAVHQITGHLNRINTIKHP